MTYLSNLESTIESLEYKVESMTNQIQLMYAYMGHLESAEKELVCMLYKYHSDDCIACDNAYKAHDMVIFQRGVFNGCAMTGMEKDDWIVQEVKRAP